MSGVGAPGATINLIRKRPTREFQARASVETGSWDFYRAEADLSTPLNDAGTVRGRLVAAWQKNGSRVERLQERGKTLYGIVEADLRPDAFLATLGFLYQNQDATGHSRLGLPIVYTDGGRAGLGSLQIRRRSVGLFPAAHPDVGLRRWSIVSRMAGG
ncbi:hypothetical protein [Castellaniella defragrans]|uniref:hypothetical protein n=1 Tax=Castellaniella defragrans TaxID=75697 RepID=UPI002AFF0653|nr:hypothetical protein [Castellaniella defragrans]